MTAAQERMRKAVERLHHLSMRYSGAFVELVAQKPVGLLKQNHPGLKEARDFIDLILITRAEINALTNLLIKSGHLNEEAFTEELADQYDWLCKQKAEFLGIEVTDYGITYKVPTPK